MDWNLSYRDAIDLNIGVLHKLRILRSPYALFLLFIGILSAIGPEIAPYGPQEFVTAESGAILQNAGPSLQHPLGTTASGYDVLSRLLVGARHTFLTGITTGSIIISLGLLVGITSGYFGGRTDEILMRFTDFVYSIPIIPFAIVLLTFLGTGYFTTVLVLGAILWRGSARVIRSQVLQIRKREYILSAEAMGGSPQYIIRKHILPNIVSMAALFFAIGTGGAILIQAGLTFIGVTNPFIPSWGVMIRNAYESGMVASALYWSLPPGFLISLTVLSIFMLGQKLEGSSESEEDLEDQEALTW